MFSVLYIKPLLVGKSHLYLQAVLKTAEILSVWKKKMDLNFAVVLLLVSYFLTLDVNYALVTERAYSHSGRHEMNLDDEGFTEMSDCIWEELRMGGGLNECSVYC